MQISCGVDIVEIERIKKAIEKTNGRFLKKIYTEKEIKYCEEKGNAKYEHYAARFASKEAIFKAISGLLKDKYSINWQNVQILNNKEGKPYIEFINMEFNQIKSMDISISHSKQNAIANVVIIY